MIQRLNVNQTTRFLRASLGNLPSKPIALRMTLFLAGKIRSVSPKPRLRKI